MKQLYRKNAIILIVTILSIFLLGVEVASAQQYCVDSSYVGDGDIPDARNCFSDISDCSTEETRIGDSDDWLVERSCYTVTSSSDEPAAPRSPNVEYVPLVSLPGVPEGQGVGLGSYLDSMFKIGIGLAGVFAVLMIVIGGIQYIGGAANPSARTEAKNKITNAIFGLVLALGAWLILYTVNPNLLKKDIIITPVTPVSGTPPTSTQSTQYCVDYYSLDSDGDREGAKITDCFLTTQNCSTRESSLRGHDGWSIDRNCYTR